jgi:hypothetical protein
MQVPVPLAEEIHHLAESSAQDFERKFFANYQTYLSRLNSILQTLHAEGLFTEVALLESVPESRRAYLGMGFSDDEQAKMRETVNVATLLSRRLKANVPEARTSALASIERLCSRFHLVANQLRDGRGAARRQKLADEYEVQNLLHALLLLEFDDVRAEEWTPSYAGGCARIDFLLKAESIVIEVKKTRKGLGGRELGEQLLIDIAKYRQHPDCRELICFVYDPEERIQNPRGIEADLASQSRQEMSVAVFIRPRHS